jgi:hypothetical protein
MKKALFVLAAAGLLVWVVSWFRAPEAVATSGAQPWPGGMGTLDSVARRLSPIRANEASAKLAKLAGTLPANDAVNAFVPHEIARGELSIGNPPVLLDVSAIRELLLREPVVWDRPAGVGGIGDKATNARRAIQMTVARALVADALAKARTNDPASWDDLHAAWNLARSFDPQPQMMEQTAALTIVRMINAVAWKMPLPAPAWFDELQQRDEIQPLLTAFQYQAASYWRDGTTMFPTKMLAESAEHDRKIAEAVLKETRCDVTVPMNDLGTDLSSVWRRAFRYRAEREATANALGIRAGKPIEAHSRCTDGSWTYDGTTLRFTRPIPTTPPDTPMPLVLRLARY